jgi:hypothetical protein
MDNRSIGFKEQFIPTPLADSRQGKSLTLSPALRRIQERLCGTKGSGHPGGRDLVSASKRVKGEQKGVIRSHKCKR